MKVPCSGQLPEPLPSSPWPMFRSWFDEAMMRRDQPNPNAMSLATVEPDGWPASRIVLCKDIQDSPESIVFFTNYLSRKAMALQGTPRAGACFHWDGLERQVRITGPVSRTSAQTSDRYFASRSLISRISSAASAQSTPIDSRAAMRSKFDAVCADCSLDPEKVMSGEADESATVPRPTHWGGYVLVAARVELWVGALGRFHDRAEWSREMAMSGGTPVRGDWVATRLQP